MIKRNGVFRLSLCSAALLASGCSVPSSPRSELLSQSYRAIDAAYVEPMPSSTLAIGSLRRLTAIDGSITVESMGHQRELVLKRGGNPLQRFPAPSATDWRGWGETADQVTAAAIEASPAIAAVPSRALDEALLGGALSGLDRYSYYFPPRTVERVPDRNDAIAARSDARTGRVSPSPIPPAKPSAVADGPADSQSVRLTLNHGAAVVRISRFTSSTSRVLRRELAWAAENAGDLRGVVLDLRNNPGGLITAAAQVTKLFLSHGTIARLTPRDPKDREVLSASSAGSTYGRVRLVVLVNGRSMSAAELVAAALQGNGRALVVGSASFGKGTAQKIFKLSNGGELWVTSAFLTAPAGYVLHHHGVIPDICTDLASGGTSGHDHGSADARQRFLELSGRPRASLSEEQWTELRGLCPGPVGPSDNDRDLRIAEHIFTGERGDLP